MNTVKTFLRLYLYMMLGVFSCLFCKGDESTPGIDVGKYSLPHFFEKPFGLPLVDLPTSGLTVFIHGTVGSSFGIFNIFQYWRGEIEDDAFSVRFLRGYRNRPEMGYDQVLAEEGFLPIDMDSKAIFSAASYIIPAYDQIQKLFVKDVAFEEYATFGWSGLLSQKARREAGLELYEELVAYRDSAIKKYGKAPIIRIIAHSHGGNVALWLAECEKKLGKNLSIDLLFMYGTPMQSETAECITSPIFKKIFLGYSRGDSVQRRDIFSTFAHRSFMQMSDVTDISSWVKINPGFVRADLGFIIQGDDQRVTHTNMWLAGRSVPIFSFMEPLPLFVLTPQIVAVLDQAMKKDCGCTHYKVHLNAGHRCCWSMAVSCTEHQKSRRKGIHKRRFERFGESCICRDCDKQVYDLLVNWSKKMMQDWRPFDPSRDVLFNRKNWQILMKTFSVQ